MSEIEIKQMQEKINAGILLARKRLIEKVKKEDGRIWSLSGMENRPPQSQGPQITPLTLKQRLYPRPHGRGFFTCIRNAKEHPQQKSREYPGFSVFSIYNRNYLTDSYL